MHPRVSRAGGHAASAPIRLASRAGRPWQAGHGKGKSKVLLRACSIEVTKYLSKFTLAKQGETLTLG